MCPSTDPCTLPFPGRFLRPLYRAMYNSKSGAAKQVALETYAEHKDNYHPIAAKMVAVDLKLAQPAEEQ